MAERYLVRQARARPDPERGVPLSERPGQASRVRSFDGTELEVNVVSPGTPAPTVVFIHGFTLDMTAWHYQWKGFSRDYRCVLYDQRGHGRSAQAAGGDYSLQALGRDIKAILDTACPEGPVALVGHSMGGMAIMAFAEQHPEEFGARVAAVVLADTSASDIIREMLSGLGTRGATFAVRHARRLTGAAPAAQRLRSRALAPRSGLAFLVAEAMNFGPHASPTLIDHVVRVAAQARPEVWTDLATSLVEMDLGHALEHITCPALIVVGDADRLTPPSSARAMQRRLPDARVVVLRGAGHCAILERHAQFNVVLARFLREMLPKVHGKRTARPRIGRGSEDRPRSKQVPGGSRS
jgi:pimeloyl-ACP methyl ester carboxylesterase